VTADRRPPESSPERDPQLRLTMLLAIALVGLVFVGALVFWLRVLAP
jgi:hypothetical protein